MARWSQKVPPTPSKCKERRPREGSKDFEGSPGPTASRVQAYSQRRSLCGRPPTRWHPAACTSRDTDGLEAASVLTAAVWLVSGDASCVSSLLPMEQRPNPWPGMLASYLHTHTLEGLPKLPSGTPTAFPHLAFFVHALSLSPRLMCLSSWLPPGKSLMALA